MQFWGDIIVHYPDLVPELPKDVTAMLWGYEGGEKAAAEWERQCSLLEQSGVPFYVCPGTSSWNSIAGRSDNAIDNCRISAKSGLKHGAIGFLNTDWGDNGHWQPFSISYLGYAYGAGVSWCLQTNDQLNLAPLLDLFIFNDAAGIMGKLAYDLGEVYKIIGPEHINGQVLAYAMQVSTNDLENRMKALEAWGGDKPNVSPEALHRAVQTINQIIAPLNQAKMERPDAVLVSAEFQQAANMLLHSANRLLFVLDEEGSPQTLNAELQNVMARHRQLWLTRSRHGGLDDSLKRFDTLNNEYQELLNT
jgi:hypothetical protein